jgi:hypothetical protein
MKPKSNGIVLPGTAEAAKEAVLAKQKVELYSDLTNLVILGMKRNDDDEDVYDCLQTGRNGSTLPTHPILYSTTRSLKKRNTNATFSPPLPPHCRRIKRLQLRRHRVRLPAASQRTKGPRVAGSLAGLSNRGDLLSARTGGEVLLQGCGFDEQEDCAGGGGGVSGVGWRECGGVWSLG